MFYEKPSEIKYEGLRAVKAIRISVGKSNGEWPGEEKVFISFFGVEERYTGIIAQIMLPLKIMSVESVIDILVNTYKGTYAGIEKGNLYESVYIYEKMKDVIDWGESLCLMKQLSGQNT
jgi:hypothetical protein